jgi:FixJ family two-component response regulator
VHSPEQRPTAFVVDDDDAIRTLWQWLMESSGIAVRVFPTATAFLEAYDGAPGCLMLDLQLPDMSGLEVQAELKRKGFDIPIVFVSGHGDVATAVSAIKGGAVDFIEKPFAYRDVLAIVEKAFRRDADNRDHHARRAVAASRLADLTARERAVLQRVVEGKQNKLIAAELEISVKTVEVHRAKLMEKMGAGSVAELVQLALGFPLVEGSGTDG